MDRGWRRIWALAGAQLVSWGSIYYSFSLMVVPMERELGWTRTAINGALSVGLLTSGFVAYPVGAWIDRRGGRLIMTLGSVVAAILLALWSRASSVGGYYAIWIGLGFALAGTLYEPVFTVITQDFPDSFRTKITALTLVGGFASTVFIPLTQWLIHLFGWRHALAALALCNVVVCVPIHLWVLRGSGSRRLPEPGPPRPQEAALSPQGSASQGDHSSGEARRARRSEEGGVVRRALRSRVFWALALCFTFYYTAFSALTFHLIPLLSDRAVPMTTIIAAVALIGPAQVLGRIVLLTFRRHASARHAGRFATLVFPAAILLVIAFPLSTAALFAFMGLFGIANGIVTIVRGTAVPELMWREGYGAINGALSLPANLARGAAPFAAAVVWSAAGDYRAVLWSTFAIACAAAAGFWYAAAHPAASSQETDR